MNTKKSELALKYRLLLLFISLIIVVADQITKLIARESMDLFAQKTVNSFWNWTLAYNQGAAFSLFANEGGWQRIFFGVLAFVVSVALVFYILNRNYSYFVGFAVSFILGGAIGNLVDRIIFGKVTDFIDWHYLNYHWPSFNIADSFIVVGITFLIIDSMFCSKNK